MAIFSKEKRERSVSHPLNVWYEGRLIIPRMSKLLKSWIHRA